MINILRITLLGLICSTSAGALDGRGNGGADERIRLVAEAPDRALEILGKIDAGDIEVHFIPPNLAKHGMTPEVVSEWFEKNWDQLRGEFGKHELDTHNFADVVDDRHQADDAFTFRDNDRAPIYFNVNSGRFENAEDAAWVLLNEYLHHIDDDEVINRSDWSVEDEDTFSAFMTGILRLNFYRVSHENHPTDDRFAKLREALQASNLGPFLELLAEAQTSSDFDIDQRDYKGRSLLMLSVQVLLDQDEDSHIVPFQLQMIDALLVADADVDILDNHGQSLFHMVQPKGAFWLKQPDQAASLLTRLLEQSRVRNPYMNDPALSWAVEVGHVAFIGEILASGTSQTRRGEILRNSLERDASSLSDDYHAMLRPILEQGVPQQRLDYVYHIHMTLGHFPTTALLSEFGAGVFGLAEYPDVNVMMSVMDSHILSLEQKVEALEQLLERDDIADWVNTRSEYFHPGSFDEPRSKERDGLFSSGFGRLVEVYSKLNVRLEDNPFVDLIAPWLEAGVDVNQIQGRASSSLSNPAEQTYLHMALRARDPRSLYGAPPSAVHLVKALIDYGSDVNQLVGDGRSPLLLAQFNFFSYELVCGERYDEAGPGAQARYSRLINNQREIADYLEANGATLAGEIDYDWPSNVHRCGRGLTMPTALEETILGDRSFTGL